MPPPPKPAASPAAYSPGIGSPSGRSTRDSRSVWIPPRLLRAITVIRIAISGPAFGSTIGWNLEVRSRSPRQLRSDWMRRS